MELRTDSDLDLVLSTLAARRVDYNLLCLAIEPGAPGNLNQILIVGSAVNFGLSGLELSRFVLHGKSSEHVIERNSLETDGAG
jgi:hypothetical protein